MVVVQSNPGRSARVKLDDGAGGTPLKVLNIIYTGEKADIV